VLNRLRAFMRGAFHAFYEAIFSVSPSISVRKFFRDLGWIGLTFGLSRVIAGVVTIFAARLMGPAEFGKVNLALGAASLLSVGMLFGLNASIVKYGVSAVESTSAISLGFLLTALFTCAATTVGILFRGSLAILLGVSPEIYWYGVWFAVFFTLYTVVGSAQQASQRFKERGWAELLFAILLAAGFGLGLLWRGRTFPSLTSAYVLAYSISGIIWILPLLPRRCWPASPPRKGLLKEMLSYGFYNFVCGIGFFLTSNTQRFVINRIMSEADVGIWGAYGVGTIGLAFYGWTMLSTVFFPRASATTNREGLWNTLVRSWTWAALPTVAVFMAAQTAILLLMGRSKYPISPLLLLLFAVCSTIIMIQSSLGQVLGAQGVRGARLGLWTSITAGLVNLALCPVLIPRFGVAGAAIALSVSYLVSLVWCVTVRKLYFETSSPNPDASELRA
jgi:lipopolysaccharide exporter